MPMRSKSTRRPPTTDTERAAEVKAKKYELLDAAQGDDCETIRSLIEQGLAHIGTCDAHQFTALHTAVKGNKIAATKLLIDLGADVNAQDKYGWTPLHLASRKGLTEIVKLLVKSGAKLEARDKLYQDTPLLKSVWDGHTVTALSLVDLGANLYQLDEDQKDAMALASMNKQFETQRALSKIKEVERHRQESIIAVAYTEKLRNSKIIESTRSAASEMAIKRL